MDATLYAALIGIAGLALVARAIRVERDRAAWALLGVGLLSWFLGDLFLLLWPDTEAYPSTADFLYFGFYALAVAGLRRLGTSPRGSGQRGWALLSATLGLATLWSWLVFGPALEDVEGPESAVATTLAYPLFDLLLLGGAVFVIAAHGWKLRGGALALTAGIAVTAIADGLWVNEVAGGQLETSAWLEPFWPIGALLLALAGWSAFPARTGRGEGGDAANSAVAHAFAGGSMAIALVVLVWDHWERLSNLTIAFSMLTLLAAIAQLILLYRAQAIGERERRELSALLAASAHASLDAIITSDARAHVTAWNPAAERTFGYSREQAMGKPVGELVVPPDLRDDHSELLRRLLAGGESRALGGRVETIGMRADGSRFPMELTISRVQAEEPMFTAYVRDISDRKRRDEERERLSAMVRSTEDAMFSTTLDGVIIAWNPACSRLYGYSAEEAVGTQMLDKIVPSELRAEARENLQRVARGEAITFETRRAHREGNVLDVSIRYFPIRDEVGHVSACTLVVRDITDRRRRQIEEHRNRERRAWRAHVETALETEGFEFHAQPVVSLKDHSISHHELLLRLKLDREIVPPGKFLPHVEQSPLMRRIDRWAIDRGIQMSRKGRVAINLSATSLADAGIISAVERALDAHGADAHDVIFEITETAAAENLDAASSLTAALRQIGCGVALDDFGTGYGSFTYLKRLSATELKIDMEFIRGLAEDPADQRIVRSIVAVAQNFEIETVAEGVEDARTLDTIRGMGVDFAQGYLLGRPGVTWKTSEDVRVSLA